MKVLIGAASWSDRTLTRDSGWYPRKTMKAAERMAFYASRLPLVEVDSTYRFPPTPDVSRQWVERTPDGFTIDVPAWSLLCLQPALPDSLWPDLHDEVNPEAQDKQRLYASHLSAAALAECWRRFDHAIAPLADAGRLGVVLLQLPHWLKPGDTARTYLAEARARLADRRLAVQFTHPDWTEGGQCEETMALLEDHDLAFVCTDAPQLPPVTATTADVAVVRFHGAPDPEWAHLPLRAGWRYESRYRAGELAAWVPRVVELAGTADEVHVVFANTYRDHAVTNAEELAAMIAAELSPDRVLGSEG